MEIRQLEYFKALIETGTFSAAAQRVGVAQPSLSQQILKLEQELGEALVIRSRNGIKLTEAGELLRGKAQSILTGIGDIERVFSGRTGTDKGRINMGAIPTIAPYLLPPALAKFRDKQPHVGIDLLENKTEHLLEKILSGEIDFAIASDIDAVVSGVADEELYREELLLAVSNHSPFAKRRQLTLDDLREASLLVLQDGHCLKDDTIRQCRAHDFKPRQGLRCANLETLLGLIEANLGVAFIPWMAIATHRHRALKFRRLHGVTFTRSIRLLGLVDKKYSEAEQQLIKILVGTKKRAGSRDGMRRR